MKKQIGCHHRKKWCYTYKLIGIECNFCNECEKKLRKKIIEQDKFERDLK